MCHEQAIYLTHSDCIERSERLRSSAIVNDSLSVFVIQRSNDVTIVIQLLQSNGLSNGINDESKFKLDGFTQHDFLVVVQLAFIEHGQRLPKRELVEIEQYR